MKIILFSSQPKYIRRTYVRILKSGRMGVSE